MQESLAIPGNSSIMGADGNFRSELCALPLSKEMAFGRTEIVSMEFREVDVEIF